ncbi:hypothetical protein [Nocardia fusca]|uniref:hypothetical protein n=1 Tax=Nocardia fusca TaxID=941183 RepID=UPI0007A7360F|nr:hypothetical protein [Nocardia fusca]
MPENLQPAASSGPDPAGGAQLEDALRAADRAEPSNFERLVHLGRSDTMANFTAALIEAKGQSN